MTLAVGRFLTFELGTGNQEKLQKVFSTSINVLLLLSLFILLIAETIGLWFVNNKLQISIERNFAANWIYQLTVLAFILEIIGVPYSSSIISHEKMGAFAFVTILKVLLTFGIALLLSVSPIDRLIFYGVLVFLVNLGIQLLYWSYCRANFKECRYSTAIDKSIFKEMFGFAGWFFLATCSSMMSSQGVNILLNMHFGTLINAARGVCGQLNGTVGAFATNFTKALNPQITKSYAAQDYNQTRTLVCRGTKFSYILLFVIALPCMLETDFFLSKWLKEVPPYAGVFVQLTLLNALVDILLNTVGTLNTATGKIRNYQILNCSAQWLIFLSTYFTLKIYESPILAVALGNIINILAFYPRIAINKFAVGISFRYYFQQAIGRILAMSILSITICLAVIYYIQDGWVRFITICFLSTASIFFFSWLIVLTNSEKNTIMGFVRSKLHLRK
ncbi:MAG: lipopolysaccharide biosynthesis protein [Prevotella sp.]|nr:lipopolysaccharide biosynthesis protein [Prevotella sp.]